MDKNEAGQRRTAALVFRRLIRESAVRAMFGVDPAHTLVCLDSDSLGSMLDSLGHHHPQGATVSIYYPAEHCFRFMQWIPEGVEGRQLPAHADTTVGMAVAAARAEQGNWTARVPEFSTASIERELAVA